MPYGFPDICGFYDMLYGTAGVDLQGLTCLYFGDASGQVFSGNPAYTVVDFLQIYPKFFGPPTNFTGLTITANSTLVSGFIDVSMFQQGQLVVNYNSLQDDTLIQSVDTVNKTVTLSQPATQNDTVLTVYTTPFVPLLVVITYLQLALASVMQARYQEAWVIAVAYFVAHFLTLFMRSESGSQNYTAQKAATSGLTKGIIVHRSAGDVSATSKILEGFEEWGAWRETQYGELFITMARSVAAGPIWMS